MSLLIGLTTKKRKEKTELLNVFVPGSRNVPLFGSEPRPFHAVKISLKKYILKAF